MIYELPKDITELILEICGESLSIQDAFDQWKRERKAMSEFYDENQAYSIITHRLLIALELAEKAIAAAEADAGLFIKDHTRRAIAKFREQIQIVEKHKEHLNKLKKGDPHETKIQTD